MASDVQRIGVIRAGDGVRCSAAAVPFDTTPLARALTTASTTTVDPVPVITTVHPLAAQSASPPQDSLSRRLSSRLRV
jgi:hypothetical protein